MARKKVNKAAGKKTPVQKTRPVKQREKKSVSKKKKQTHAAAVSVVQSEMSIGAIRHDVSPLSDFDIYLFKEGTHGKAYSKLGSHCMEANGLKGTYFAVWAPNAEKISVIGDFNAWNDNSHPLAVRWDGSGIWEGFIPGVCQGELYKYAITSRFGNYREEKSDPYAYYWEIAPNTASRVWDLSYEWEDSEWMRTRKEKNNIEAPMSIYEMHLGSWRRVPHEGNRYLTYREMAPFLVDHVKNLGFTHVEFLPVMEHPFYGSWGYQSIGYFAPTSRYGTPQDFMYLIDCLHQNNIGVILDWVPSHFPSDKHGLAFFDGTHLYEHEDARKGFHPDWKSYIFNYGRSEVRNFLISSALFWLEKYHIDGIRVDAVASMLYLDYSRKQGEWIANEFGGRENIEAIQFLRQFNSEVYKEYPDVQTMAEESTAWPMVSRPNYVGGLGFGFKWNMGWMHDTLEYFSKDPIHRMYHHNQLTFSICYAFSENFVMPLSHDEIVYGKGSLLGKMPGDDWQKKANLRLLYGYMFTHPGKKLLMMGSEFGQWHEWNHESSIDWHLLEDAGHRGITNWLRDIATLYKHEVALHKYDCNPKGFNWIDCNDCVDSILSFRRCADYSDDDIVVVCNFTPVPRMNYRIGVPEAGVWNEIANSDAKIYGGSGWGNLGRIRTVPVSAHGHFNSISIVLPPLSAIVLKKGKSVWES